MVNSLLGQYSYKNTLIHRLDPRVKVLLTVFISISLFFLNTFTSFLIFSIFVILLMSISKIKCIRLLKNLRPFAFFFAFILLMYLLFSREQLEQGIIVVWRFVLLVFVSSILTFSTSISQLVYAIEKLFAPLKSLGIRPRNIAVMVSITIRFIPLLFLETGKIKDALNSRMADLKKKRHIAGLVNALLRKTFNKAGNLADAMESRCYRDKGYTNFIKLKLSVKDYTAALAVIIFVVTLLWIKI